MEDDVELDYIEDTHIEVDRKKIQEILNNCIENNKNADGSYTKIYYYDDSILLTNRENAKSARIEYYDKNRKLIKKDLIDIL